MARLGTNEGKANVRQASLLDARALAMVESRIHGRSLATIAEEFNVSIDTVRRSLTRAEKFDLAERYEDYLVGRLAGLAIGAYEHALLENDTAVATKVLESIGLIRKPKESGRAEEEGDTWEAYLKVRRTGGRSDETGTATAAPAGGLEAALRPGEPALETLDGEVADEVGVSGDPGVADAPSARAGV